MFASIVGYRRVDHHAATLEFLGFARPCGDNDLPEGTRVTDDDCAQFM